MAFKLQLKPVVLLDADEAVRYYEHRLSGLGNRFYVSLLSALDQVQSNPFNYSFVKDPVRRIRIEKFPYRMFYIISNDSIIVIGISHAKRSNAFIKRRLRLL